MTINDQRKIVMVKSVDSNIIEEAILILKDENYMNVSNEVKEKRNFIIMDEAYSIINNFETSKSDLLNSLINQKPEQSTFWKVWNKLFSPFSIFLIAATIYIIYRIM